MKAKMGWGWTAALVLLLFSGPAFGQVAGFQKISDTVGGFTGTLDDLDVFGNGLAVIGDLDGDMVPDLVVGAPLDDDGGGASFSDFGAVYVLFMNADGTVKGFQKISATAGGFTGGIGQGDNFGTGAAALGDLDGDGVPDLAVGTPLDDDGGADRGAVYVLFMNTDGTVKASRKISDTEGGFTGTLHDQDYFGWSVAALGDLDGDTVPDLAVGARVDDDGGTNRGAVWILFMNTDGTVKGEQKISSTSGGFTGSLTDSAEFGVSVAPLDDLDGDTVPDLAVGADRDDDTGSVWILFLNTDGTVKAEQEINGASGGFTGTLDSGDGFGFGVANLGDFDGDTVPDLAVGVPFDDDGGVTTFVDRGAVWVLLMNPDGTVRNNYKISDTEGGFTGTLDDTDHFGWTLAALGDLDGDMVPDLVASAPLDDDGGSDRGAVYVLFLDDAVLPVELAAFEARADGPAVVLRWRTASETNNAGFTVEGRRADVAEPWRSFGFVEGAGTTTEAQAYAFRIGDLAPGRYRFRLRQTDFDGAFTFGPEVAVAVTVPGRFFLSDVYPNPFNPQTRFTLAVPRTQAVNASVYDLAGRRVRTLFDGVMRAEESRTFVVDGAGLPSGVYVLRVLGETFTAARSMVVLK
ncbi:T9SS type A sorting domain-containing protein [Rhodocaloribacter sp.]